MPKTPSKKTFLLLGGEISLGTGSLRSLA